MKIMRVCARACRCVCVRARDAFADLHLYLSNTFSATSYPGMNFFGAHTHSLGPAGFLFLVSWPSVLHYLNYILLFLAWTKTKIAQ